MQLAVVLGPGLVKRKSATKVSRNIHVFLIKQIWLALLLPLLPYYSLECRYNAKRCSSHHVTKRQRA